MSDFNTYQDNIRQFAIYHKELGPFSVIMDLMNNVGILSNKLYNVLADISLFMDKIKVKNFTFTFDGTNINNLENIRKLIFNIQPGAKSNIRSSDNSKDDANSSKRKTNVQSTSGSGVYLN